VRRTPAEDVVEFLSFSSDPLECANTFATFRVRQWQHVLEWLNDAGLAFYFLEKLNSIGTACRVPSWVVAHLEKDFAANQQRGSEMSRHLGFLNQRLNNAGVRYVVIKGLSLVPAFCPKPDLRYQSDFDYLVDDVSLSAAERVLQQAGYRLKLPHSGQEFIFVKDVAKESEGEKYPCPAPHSVELHLDIWDSDYYSLPSIPRVFSLDRVRSHEWNGMVFPVLPEEDAFLLQILHAYQHSVTFWIRMSWLFEIGYFLNLRASDESLWSRVEQRVGDNPVLREFIVIVIELVSKLFAPSLPLLIRDWGRMLRRGPRTWIESYARHWAFSEAPIYRLCFFPRAKLVLFLHQQYKDPSLQKRLVRDRLLPSTRLSSIASSVKQKPSLILDAGWWKHQRLIGRGLFHGLAGLRYVCEIPRWLWLNRATTRGDSVTARPEL
jgi:Uncharacterised nucleotidyltransferase